MVIRLQTTREEQNIGDIRNPYYRSSKFLFTLKFMFKAFVARSVYTSCFKLNVTDYKVLNSPSGG